ncbi:hypothetical protein G6F59_018166 [Rhizopus arrhizus]|nr:hypothetical protein G6F59_018166 [Rhizopus arrhizus]
MPTRCPCTCVRWTATTACPTTPWSCPRMAALSRACTSASRSSTSITATVWLKSWKRAPRSRSRPPTSCRCWSSASWTCTS